MHLFILVVFVSFILLRSILVLGVVCTGLRLLHLFELFVVGDPFVDGLLLIEDVDLQLIGSASDLLELRVAPFLLKFCDQAILWHLRANETRLKVLASCWVIVVDLAPLGLEERQATVRLFLVAQLRLLLVAVVVLELIARQLLVVLGASREQVSTILDRQPLQLHVLNQTASALHFPLQLLHDGVLAQLWKDGQVVFVMIYEVAPLLDAQQIRLFFRSRFARATLVTLDMEG